MGEEKLQNSLNAQFIFAACRNEWRFQHVKFQALLPPCLFQSAYKLNFLQSKKICTKASYFFEYISST